MFVFYTTLAGSIADVLMLLYVIRYHVYSKKTTENFYSIFLISIFLFWNAAEFFRIFGDRFFQITFFEMFALFSSVAVALEIATFLKTSKLRSLQIFFAIIGSTIFTYLKFSNLNVTLFSTSFFTLNSVFLVTYLIFKHVKCRSFTVRGKITLSVLYYLAFSAFEAIIVWTYLSFKLPYFTIFNAPVISVYLYILMALTYGKNMEFSSDFFKNAFYGSLGAFFVSLFFIIGYYVNSYFAGKIGVAQSFAMNFVLVYFIFMAFGGFLKKLDVFVERITKTGISYYRENMMKFTSKVLHSDDLEEFSKQVSKYLLKVINASDVEVFFTDDDGNFISPRRILNKEMLESISQRKKIVDLYVLKRKPRFLTSKELLVWVKSFDEIVGCLVIGCKRFGKYTASDMEIVNIVSNQVALFLAQYRAVERVKKAEKVLFLQERMAALGRLASGMAHEIRNPLNIISTSLQMMNEEGSDGEKLKSYILEEIERINGILSNFLDFAKRQPEKLEEVNLNEIMQKTVLLLKDSASKRSILVESELPLYDTWIKADKNMIMEVMLNLGTNALEAVKERGIVLFSLWKDEKFAYVNVSNDGPPIPLEDLSLIFEPFFTTKENGTGLGLAIVYNYIYAMNGTVEVKSDEKKTSFIVKVPLEVKP